jgi:hypothetical protein
MTFMRIGLPVVVFGPWKARLPAKARQTAGRCFSTFQVVVFSETEHP